ncbi:MAG: sigma-70 family RNA polymerase sigma factor [Clostridia bacterium]|nr:sigma-70 family RNA polymerase sigma factor [Clostridia bacterium]
MDVKRDALTELALRAQKDDAAFEELVRQTESLVYNMALRSTGGEEHDASDLTQDIYIKVWRSLPSFRGDSQFSTWLYRIVQNASADRARKLKRNQTVSLTVENDDEERGEMEIEDLSPNPEEMTLEKESAGAVKEALSRLSDAHREVLELRYIHGYSVLEICKITETDEGTVKSRLFRAREKLKKVLEKGNFFG